MDSKNSEWPSEVLLVEDNPADVFLVQRSVLKGKWNINLHVVEDGVSGMDFLMKRGEYTQSPTPNLILLDLNLPRMDGRAFMKELIKTPDLAGLPVVVLTTSENESDVLGMYRLRCSAYFVKPVDLPRFSTLMEEIWAYWKAAQMLPGSADEESTPDRLPPKPRRVWVSDRS